MKHYRIYLSIAILVLAMLACQTVMGGGNRDVEDVPSTTEETITQPDSTQPNEPPVELQATESNSSNSATTVSTDFPMTKDAYNIVDVGDGSLIYYTKLSADDVMQFYRDEYASKGYTERKDLTIVTSGTFSMVFDGDPSGKAVVIQSVDLGDGSRTISIRLEDV